MTSSMYTWLALEYRLNEVGINGEGVGINGEGVGINEVLESFLKVKN